MGSWQIVSDGGIDALRYSESGADEPAVNQLKIRLRASAVNYRDLAAILDPVPRGIAYPTTVNSDMAGDVVAIGPGVQGYSVGDRVASCFFQNWQDGPCSPQAMNSALGGAVDGVLSQEVILSAEGVVKLPEHLTYEEGATLPCAALTAWNAIAEAGQLRPGQTILLIGTGGVSIFALQFANLFGARAIILSSSDQKLARARELGAFATINYTRHPEWHAEVMDATQGAGVDLTVEVGGGGTLARSIEATRVGGTIALIGVLTNGEINPTSIMRKSICLQGIYVGSRRMFTDMNDAIAMHKMRPVVDQSFAFEDARAAYHAMRKAAHFGKIVITT